VILIDTQVAIWMTVERKRLSTAAARTLRDSSRSGGGLSIAGTSLWEIAMFANKGRLDLQASLPELLKHVEAAFIVLPITSAIAARSIAFSANYPNDPADRIIGATAIEHGLKLVTSDAKIRKSGEVPCIW
jgi:PIN domain nuclease of toxin-antitoxin system